MVREGLEPNWCLLLPALGQVPDHVHNAHQPRQVGPLERGLGNHMSRRPRPPSAANWGPNRQAQRLGGGPEAAKVLRVRD
jgi:hypothetical protein